MERKCIFILAFICVGMSAVAQSTITDTELSALVDVVKMLRTSNETNFNKAREILEKDLKWTMMDETGPVRDVECKASDHVSRFRLNKILSKISGSRKYVTTHGDMVNGQSSVYDYSLYERALQPNKKVSYSLKGREGKQTFVLLPYDSTAKFEVCVYCNRKIVSEKPVWQDGMAIIQWNRTLPSKSQNFELVIKNMTGAPQSFVIINHNTRKK